MLNMKKIIYVLLGVLLTESLMCSVYAEEFNSIMLKPDFCITELEEDFSVVAFEGDDDLEDFLAQGGADSDYALIDYLTQKYEVPLRLDQLCVGCSTISTFSERGDALWGRNLDFAPCDGCILIASPEKGYRSVSTVMLDVAGKEEINLADENLVKALLYAPVDGMNEEGFCISVNMVDDITSFDQNTDRIDLTVTSAVRVLLNQAATVDEAITLLQQYDLHRLTQGNSHFSMSDAQGKSVVVEYIDNEMYVTETQVVTNTYLTEGEKYGIGSDNSLQRYNILNVILNTGLPMEMGDVRDTLASVSRGSFGADAGQTQWTLVCNKTTREVEYYHRENYMRAYCFQFE